MTSKFVRRVDQLDSNVLDEELLFLLNSQYRKAFVYLPNSVLARLGPELDVLFKFLFKCLPLCELKCTFGQSLFQLQYHHSGSQQLAPSNKLCALALISVCVPWFWDRVVRKIILSLPNNELSNKTLDASYVLERKFSTVHQLLTLINFCIFLQKSTYLTLYERLLRVRPLYSAPQNIRSVQSDNIERELLWHGLSEFLGFALPLINVTKIKGFFKRTFLPKSYKSHYRKYFIHSDLCSICGDIPNFPHTFGCCHVFCYYCISCILLADPSYICLDCDVKADGIENLKPLDSAKI